MKAEGKFSLFTDSHDEGEMDGWALCSDFGCSRDRFVSCTTGRTPPTTQATGLCCPKTGPIEVGSTLRSDSTSRHIIALRCTLA